MKLVIEIPEIDDLSAEVLESILTSVTAEVVEDHEYRRYLGTDGAPSEVRDLEGRVEAVISYKA